MSSIAERKKKSFVPSRSNSSNRLSGLFKNILGKKTKKTLVVLVDDDEKNIREITSMIESLQSDVEVVSAKDGIDGLVLLKTHAEDVRLCLADMVMPGCSGIELLNRARADPSLQRVTFALMTEFSSGKDGKKTLSHFQVSDDRGDPVAVLIKPLHSALLEEMLKKLNDPEAASQAGVHRKHSQATLLNAGIDADPDWNRHRSRSDWSARHSLDVPKTQTPSPGSESPRLSPGRADASAPSPRGSGILRTSGVPSALDNPARRSSTSPRRSSGTFSASSRQVLTGSGSALPKLQRQKSNTVSFDSRDEAMASLNNSSGTPTNLSPRVSVEGSPRSNGNSPRAAGGSDAMPRSVSSYHIASDQAPNSPEIPRSTSLYAIDQSAAMSPRVRRLRSNNSPMTSPRGSRKGSKTQSNASPPEHEKEGSDGVNAGSKRWSMRHNKEGIVDESQGVNDIMFDSISSLDRDQVPRSVSMDALNWDEVV